MPPRTGDGEMMYVLKKKKQGKAEERGKSEIQISKKVPEEKGEAGHSLKRGEKGAENSVQANLKFKSVYCCKVNPHLCLFNMHT